MILQDLMILRDLTNHRDLASHLVQVPTIEEVQVLQDLPKLPVAYNHWDLTSHLVQVPVLTIEEVQVLMMQLLLNHPTLQDLTRDLMILWDLLNPTATQHLKFQVVSH